MPRVYTRRSVEERMWAKVQKTDTCWLWLGATAGDGYGVISIPLDVPIGKRCAKTEYVHRVSYAMHVGPNPDGLYVCHDCDVPNCINPEHLFLGTQHDNMLDCVVKGRALTGSENSESKLTDS